MVLPGDVGSGLEGPSSSVWSGQRWGKASAQASASVHVNGVRRVKGGLRGMSIP